MSSSRRKKVRAPKRYAAPALAISRATSWHDPVDSLLLSLSSPQLQLVTFLVGCLVVISRRPDAILNPQFWAEDGVTFYRDAYTGGFRSLVLPYVGYLVSLQRLVALAG